MLVIASPGWVVVIWERKDAEPISLRDIGPVGGVTNAAKGSSYRRLVEFRNSKLRVSLSADSATLSSSILK